MQLNFKVIYGNCIKISKIYIAVIYSLSPLGWGLGICILNERQDVLIWLILIIRQVWETLFSLNLQTLHLKKLKFSQGQMSHRNLVSDSRPKSRFLTPGTLEMWLCLLNRNEGSMVVWDSMLRYFEGSGQRILLGYTYWKLQK